MDDKRRVRKLEEEIESWLTTYCNLLPESFESLEQCRVFRSEKIELEKDIEGKLGELESFFSGDAQNEAFKLHQQRYSSLRRSFQSSKIKLEQALERARLLFSDTQVIYNIFSPLFYLLIYFPSYLI